MDKVYNFDQTQVKSCLAKNKQCLITIDEVIKVQAFLNEYNIHLIEAIGCGSFGAVLKGYDDYNQRNVAIKIILNQNPEEKQEKKEIEDEIKMNRKINSQYVIKIFEQYYDEESSCFMIVMEYCQNGDLDTYFQNKKSLEKDEIISIFTNILLGLRDIHNKNIIHSDLKPQNILLGDNYKPKICDLGLSKIIQSDKKSTRKKGGTPIYESMESMCGKVRLESDYYSAGSILCFLSGLEIESDFSMMYQLKNGIFPDINNKKQKELIEIGFQMMQIEPSQRINPEVAHDKLIKLKNNSQQIVSETNYEMKKEEINEQKNNTINKEQKNNTIIQEQKNSTINQKQQQKEALIKQLQKDLSEIKHSKIDFNSNEIKIDLNYNEIGDEGLKLLTEGLKELSNLTQLQIGLAQLDMF